MSDYGTRYTDRAEKILDWRLMQIYAEAQKDLQNKIEAFIIRSEKADDKKQEDLAAGKISEDEYKDWLAMKIFHGEQWKAKLEEVTEVLLQSNRRALAIVRNEQMNVFQENANWAAFESEKKTGYSFDIYDIASVDRLVKDKPELLPRKVVDGKKDKAWNQGNIARAITQSIIQGENIRQVAKRMANATASKNGSAMIRYARTAMTGAQNAGRIETMHQAEGMGIHVRKQWLATLDRRTRDAHRMLDGQEQDVDKPFKSEFGDIMFPGDPSADPGNVYNCRCTLIEIFPRYEKSEWQGKRLDNQTKEEIAHMSYREWIAEKEKERYGSSAQRHESDVTAKYFWSARPKEGKVTFDNGYDKNPEREEVKIARWLRDTFGGDIHVRKEQDESEGIKYCDYIWRSKQWELKSPTNFKSPDALVRDALKQIKKNPGGIIINYLWDEIDLERVVKGARKRMETIGFNADLMILHKGQLMCVKRYKK